MQPLGILSGTVIPQGSELFGDLQEALLQTEYGAVEVMRSRDVVFISRHGANPDRYVLPHQIHHRANMNALAELGVREVVAINSAGSLHRKWKPGTIMIPDDFITFTAIPSIFPNRSAHLTPQLDPEVRRRLLEAARESQVNVIDRGVYFQMPGPRLETRAEIRMIGQFADLVGMTLASEAVTAQEFGLAYGALCSIDNYGNGLVEEPLTVEQIVAHARENAQVMIAVATCYLEAYRRRTA
ncbi:MAG: S-methyl-5'-thioinosine phosphorylase [Syntrophus sp. PtaU1.Bin208]|nr:MAG: S-methyl-5'-thioinosine phosphorylase [Syntrophus sp. PtaU1.Bin208]